MLAPWKESYDLPENESEITSGVQFFAIPWTVAYQAPPSMGSPGKNTGEGFISFSRRSFQPRDWAQVSCTAGRCFTLSATREAHDQPRQHIEKQRHYLANKRSSIQGYRFSCGHVWMWELDCEESCAKELMLLNCGVGEDSWESLGLQGDPTSPFCRRSALGFLWKEWC